MSNPPIILPGLKPVRDLLRSSPGRVAKLHVKTGWRAPESLIELARSNGIAIDFRDAAFLDGLCKNSAPGHVSHQGVAAELAGDARMGLAELLAAAPTAPLPLILALDQIQDPGNLGAIARTAWALGCAGLILPEHKAAGLTPGAMRSSAGALALLPVCLSANLARALDAAEEAGLAIYGAGRLGAVPAENAYHFSWPLPAALVIGSESSGIRPGVAKRCSAMLEIPLARAFDSLNAAQASAILCALCAASRA